MAEPRPGSESSPRTRRRLVGAVVGALALVGVVLVAVALTSPASGPPSAAPSSASSSASSSSSAPSLPTALPPPPSPVVPTTAAPSRDARPTTLSVPAIGVDGPVREVGLNPDRTMEVPAPGPFYDDAAWFRGSPVPGRLGPSVIVGHVDSAADGPSVFFELGRLQPGDRAEVTLDDGTTQAFVVSEVRSFAKDEFPTLEVYGDTAGPELRLITCSGPFDSAARSYLDNTVVFARLA